MKEITKEFLQIEYVQNKRSPHDIAKEVGCCPHTIYRKLKDFEIKQEKRNGEIQSGDKFGKLTAIEVIGTYKNGTYVWNCKCECGSFVKRTTPKLKSGQLCRSCYNKNKTIVVQKLGKENPCWNGYEEISGHFISSIKICAKNRKIKFDLKTKDLWELFLKQEKKCFYSGLELHFKTREEIASLDRVDSNDYYHIDNVVWCHKDINKIKASFSVEEFVNWCNLICNFKPKFVKKNISVKLYSSYYKDLQHNAKKRHIKFEITPEEIVEVFQNQGGICALSGVELTLPESCSLYRQRIHSGSVDRINNNLGYFKDNIQIVHKKINQSRKDLTITEYRKLCNLVTKTIIL
jgi:hypothetical protein